MGNWDIVEGSASPLIGNLASASRSASKFLFFATMICAPLPWASNRDWAWGPLAMVIALIALMRGPGADRRDHVPLEKLIFPGIALALLMAWAIAGAYVAIIPGTANPIVDSAQALLGMPQQSRIALRQDAVLTGVMLWLAYGIAFLIAVDIARDSADARRICIAIVVACFLNTLYGFVSYAAYIAGGDLALFFPKFSGGIALSGTFLNRDNYATFAGLGILCAISLLRMESPSASGEPLRLRIRHVLGRLGGQTGFYLAVIVVLLIGLILSGSRAGMAAFVCGFFALIMQTRRPSLVVILLLMAVAIALLALPGGLHLVTGLASLLQQGAGERTQIYDLTIEAIKLRPWTGWGLGSFPAVYSLLQPPSLPLYFDKAHSTYLELALDLGIPAALVLPAIILTLVSRCALGVRERARRRELPALAIAATVLVGVHSAFDFPLQIPALAVLYAAILGTGWAQSWSTRRVAA